MGDGRVRGRDDALPHAATGPGRIHRVDDRVVTGAGESQNTAEDTLFEAGQYRNEELGGGPYPYSWYLSQSLQFTVAVTGKGAKGWSDAEIDTLTNQAHSAMLQDLETAVGKQS